MATSERNRLRWIGRLCGPAFFLLASDTAFASGRPDDTTRNWFADFSGGWAFFESDTATFLDDDWTLSGGATYWPSARKWGINLGLGYARFDLSSNAIQSINGLIDQDPLNSGRIDDGEVEAWQINASVIYSFGHNTNNGLYLTGGLSGTYLDGVITQTGLVYYPPLCDPWYWWCFPGGVGVGAIPQGSKSTMEYGYNVGLGYSFEAGDGKVFIEAKYHFINTDSGDITYMPLTFGYRW